MSTKHASLKRGRTYKKMERSESPDENEQQQQPALEEDNDIGVGDDIADAGDKIVTEQEQKADEEAILALDAFEAIAKKQQQQETEQKEQEDSEQVSKKAKTSETSVPPTSVKSESSSSSKPKQPVVVKLDHPVNAIERSLRNIFKIEKGYRIHPECAKIQHLTVTLSKMNAAKIEEKKKASGRANPNMKERFVNVNSMLRCMPADDTILTRWCHGLKAKLATDLNSVYRLSPPCKLNWCRLFSLGTFEKTKHAAATAEQAQHEFSACTGAYSENFVTDKGEDPSARSWLDKDIAIWNFITHEIIKNKEIAPMNHSKCADDLKTNNTPDTNTDAYAVNFLSKYIARKEGDKELKFNSSMFRYPTAADREHFKSEPYVAPHPKHHDLFYENRAANQVIYCDFPVVRPKTQAEAEATFETDDNPFVYVPFQEREAIKSGSIGSVFYEVGVTENHQGKSYYKTRPLLLIWFNNIGVKAATEKPKKPFVFPTLDVTEGMNEAETGGGEEGEIKSEA